MSEAAGQPHMRFRRSIILMFPRLDNKSLSAGGWLMYSLRDITSAAVPMRGTACDLGATQHGSWLDAARGPKAASAASWVAGS